MGRVLEGVLVVLVGAGIATYGLATGNGPVVFLGVAVAAVAAVATRWQ
jgi:hypothetical protein